MARARKSRDKSGNHPRGCNRNSLARIVSGSSPTPHGVAVSSPPFHGGSTGSNPVGVTLFHHRKLGEPSSVAAIYDGHDRHDRQSLSGNFDRHRSPLQKASSSTLKLLDLPSKNYFFIASRSAFTSSWASWTAFAWAVIIARKGAGSSSSNASL